MISFDDFKQIELRVGEVRGAERVPETDKLIRLSVDLGEEDLRTIVSGIAEYVTSESLVGKQIVFVTNLEPRTIRGVESNGMILAVGAGDGGTFSLIGPEKKVVPGSKLS